MVDSVAYMEHARRNTISVVDMRFALQRNGKTMYGY